MAILQYKNNLLTHAGLISGMLYTLGWAFFSCIVLLLFGDPANKTYYFVFYILDASLKIAFTIPLWWLFIIKLSWLSDTVKLLLHLVTATAFCFCVTGSNYLLSGALDLPDLPEIREITGITGLGNAAMFYCSEFAIFHLFSNCQRSVFRQMQEQEQMELKYQAEISALKAKLEPGFLFNALNSISASVPPSQEDTRVLIAQLADTFRYTLKLREQPVVSLEEEIDFAQSWLALEKQRFGSRLTINFEIDLETLDTPVPPMILQPLLENALHHGISQKTDGGTVTVCSKREMRHIYISVSDTGAGFEGPMDTIYTKGTGLLNTSKRLKYLFGEPLVISQNSEGMSFSFSIPILLPSPKPLQTFARSTAL